MIVNPCSALLCRHLRSNLRSRYVMLALTKRQRLTTLAPTVPRTLRMNSIPGPIREQAPAPLIDPFGRSVTYLRVSVTDRCDFRCTYCMAENMTFLPKKDLLTLEELNRLCSAFIARGVRKLRLTGGEPLVRKNIMHLVR